MIVLLLLLAINSNLFAQQSKSDKIDSFMTAVYNRGQFTGSILVADNGKVVYEKAFGLANREKKIPFTLNTQEYIGSISKQFTAMGIMILKDRQKLNYNQSIRDFFPELPAFMQQVTIRNLLYHTSGLALFADYADMTEKDVFNILLKQDKLNFTPREKFEYCNAGYSLLGMIIEKISGQSLNAFMTENIFKPLGMYYNDLKRSGVVENATLSSDPVYAVGDNTDSYSWDGMDATKRPLVSQENVSAQFVSTMGMKLAAGGDFNTRSSLDSNSVMINEAFAKQMGKEGRIGGIIRDGDNKAFTITGILKDYVYNDMYGAAAPLLLSNQPAGASVLTIRFKPGVNIQDALAKAGAVVKADNPGYPFEYVFIDDDFNQLFKTETLTGTLAGVFASLAIFISCLGLFGLAAYTAERRIKEIGIRKVLGASVSGLARLLSKDFLKLVGISCLIALPIALWAINNWLQSYQYRVSIHWWVFAIAGMIAILIALATVSFQAVKAAVTNPVNSLRSE